MTNIFSFKRSGLALVAAATLALSACSGSDETGTTTGETETQATQDALNVTTAFYPLTYLVSEIGGEHVSITDLTPPGADAHGVELSPREIADMQNSDVVFYVATMSHAIDDAVASAGLDAVEVGKHADLMTPEHLGETADEHADHAHDDHDHSDGDSHDHGTYDPHFWTDPGRMSLAAEAVTEQLIEHDPDNADAYRANGDELIAKLDALDEKFSATLSSTQCEISSFVVTHEAFGYLAHEYGLEQIGIAGIDPEFEPSPARIAQIRTLVDELGINTIFTTATGEAKVADAVADETGAKAAILDAVATNTAGDGTDYISIMEANLTELAASMNCTN